MRGAYWALAVGLAVVVGGCGGDNGIDLPAPPAVSARCGRAVRPEPERFWFRATDGTILDGAVLGSGEAGVVLVHGDPANLCDELATAGLLVRNGDSYTPGVAYPGDYHASALLLRAPYRKRVRATLIAFLRHHG